MVQSRCFCGVVTDVISLFHDGECGCVLFHCSFIMDKGTVMKFCRPLHIKWEYLYFEFQWNLIVQSKEKRKVHIIFDNPMYGSKSNGRNFPENKKVEGKK